jgi:hypothetical protein
MNKIARKLSFKVLFVFIVNVYTKNLNVKIERNMQIQFKVKHLTICLSLLFKQSLDIKKCEKGERISFNFRVVRK